MKKVIFSLCLIGWLGFGAYESFAQCACQPAYRDITAQKELKLADVVFIGKVVELKKFTNDQPAERYIETIKFEVKQAWKQDLEGLITIRNVIQGCRNGFDELEDWLVYAYKNQDGTFSTHCCCTRTRQLINAAEDLKEFETQGEKPRKVLKN
jgi:hypothetical protein